MASAVGRPIARCPREAGVLAEAARRRRSGGVHGRVLAMDIRGHGRGLRSEQPFTLDAAADDAAALLWAGNDGRPFDAHVRAPTAVIVSAHDGSSVPSASESCSNAIPGAQAVELDAAHNGWLVRPDEVAGALDQALRLVAGSPVASVGDDERTGRHTAGGTAHRDHRRPAGG